MEGQFWELARMKEKRWPRSWSGKGAELGGGEAASLGFWG